MSYSVLMSVYFKEKPEYLMTSIESMLSQTIPTDDFVIICDGPLTDELDAVLAEYQKNPIFNIVRLEENKGAGEARAIGVPLCKNEYILIMDSDDISFPNRAEIEITKLDEGFDIVGSAISEFQNDDPNDLIGVRRTPLKQEEIIKFSKKRSPFNNVSVAFRKATILVAGNYQTLHYGEDYFLWIRCLMNNAKVANVDEILVNVRSGKDQRARRGGKTYKSDMKFLHKYMYEHKYISWFRYRLNIMECVIYSALPSKLKSSLTSSVLRDKE